MNYFLFFSYYGPGTSLFYPMAPAAAAAAGIPLTATAASPFATAATNGGMHTAAGNAGALHAHNLAAAAAAAAAAQQQQHQHQQHQHHHQTHQAQTNAFAGTPFQLAGQLKTAGSLAASLTPVTSQHSAAVNVSLASNNGLVGNSVNNSVSAAVAGAGGPASKLGSPAAKKFRPAFARPSHKGSRYIPKPIPQELGNLKTYSKHFPYILLSLADFCRTLGVNFIKCGFFFIRERTSLDWSKDNIRTTAL